jgi:hypothetical protein
LARLTTDQAEYKVSLRIQKYHWAIPEQNQSWITTTQQLTVMNDSPEFIIFLNEKKKKKKVRRRAFRFISKIKMVFYINHDLDVRKLKHSQWVSGGRNVTAGLAG